MLYERRGVSCAHDAKERTAEVHVGPGGGAKAKGRGTVLLDKRGAVVGVDVEPDAASRAVIMLGAHEDVFRTVDVRLSVTRDARGEVTSVVIHGVDPPTL